MFENKKPNTKACETIDTLVGLKTEIQGDIIFSGGLRIDGKVQGNISVKGEANSTLVLSEHATVVGNVDVPHMIINGEIQGNISSSERIELQPKAEVKGDVRYRVIEMALGAVVNGNLVREDDKNAATKLKSVGGTGHNQE